MASRIKKPEWVILYIVTGLIDVFQIAIDLFLTEIFALPEGVNEFIDMAVGVGLVAYFPLRGVGIFSHMGRFASMLGMEALTDITGGAASLWILEIWYMNRSVRKEEAQERIVEKEEEALQENAARTFLYEEINGEMVRRPQPSGGSANNKPLNYLDGIRPPNGGLNPA